MTSQHLTTSSEISAKDLTLIRTGLRKAFGHSKYKADFLKKHVVTIERLTAKGNRHKVPWKKYPCARCEELFKVDAINVDHIEKVGSFKTVELIKEFFFSIFCKYENLQILCLQCHADKGVEERAQYKLDKVKAKINAPIILSEDDVAKMKEQFTLEPGGLNFEPIDTPAGVEAITYEDSTNGVETRKLFGLPLIEDYELSCPDGELQQNVALVGTVRGTEARRLITWDDDVEFVESFIQGHLHQHIKSGMIVKAIHCASLFDLMEALDLEEVTQYPVETTKAKAPVAEILSLSDLI